MTPPFLWSGFVPLRGLTRRLAAVSLSFRALTPSPLRPTASCFGVPQRPKFRVATLLPWRRLCLCAFRRMATLRQSARGPLPALSIPLAGAQLPAAPPGLRPECGSRGFAPPLFGRLCRPISAAACLHYVSASSVRALAGTPSVRVGFAAAAAVCLGRLRFTVWRFPPPPFKLTRLARRPRNNLTAFGWRGPPHAEQTQRRAWGRSAVGRSPHP